MKRNNYGSQGFTIIELLVVIGVFGLLIGFIAPNLIKTQHKASVSAAADTLIADLKSQQQKAMHGAGLDATHAASYGVTFSASSYTLFQGTADSGASTDFTVTPELVSIATTPSNSLVFSELTGETGGNFQIVLQSTLDSEKKTITINKFGVITKIQ